MTTYLHNTSFCLYAAGVYQGKIVFDESQVWTAKVDTRRRTQMQVSPFPADNSFHLPIMQISGRLDEFTATTWSGETVYMESGEEYQRHLEYEARVNGSKTKSQTWARRNDTAVDVVTLDGCVVAFICPNRYGMEVLVREGYEALTPLNVYDQFQLSKPTYGVDDMEHFWC